MKIAIICPVGDLNQYGYQYVAQPCLESWRVLGDLILIHSSRAAMPFEIEAVHVQDERTLLKVIDGQEYFDHRVIANNVSIGLDEAQRRGYHCAVTIGVNWYVEVDAARIIADKCQRLISNWRTVEILYRRWQIKDRLFDADTRIYGIINVMALTSWTVRVFLDDFDVNGESFIIGSDVRGHFPDRNDEAFIDVGLEMTDADWNAKQAHIRNYEDILPKRHGADLNFWIRYFKERRNKMHVSDEAPGDIGRQIMARRPTVSFGDRFL